ncbi:hypothetical protein [Gordonia sp. NPDC003376]
MTEAIPESARYSLVVEPVDSALLAGQWSAANPTVARSEPAPGCSDVDIAFIGSAWLTPARLESLSRDLLADIEADPFPGEVVPWILTLTTAVDDATRRRLARVHSTLDLAGSVPISM